MDAHHARLHMIIRTGLLLGTLLYGSLPATAADPVPFTRSGSLASSYTIVNLGNGWPTEIPGVNNRGDVAFSTRDESGYRALFYDGQSVRDLGNLGGNESYISNLNDLGQVVGRSKYLQGDDYYFAFRAFSWTRATGMIDLGTLPFVSWSNASAVNNRGDIVGISQYSGRLDEWAHAVRWPRGGPIADLGTI